MSAYIPKQKSHEGIARELIACGLKAGQGMAKKCPAEPRCLFSLLFAGNINACLAIRSESYSL